MSDAVTVGGVDGVELEEDGAEVLDLRARARTRCTVAAGEPSDSDRVRKAELLAAWRAARSSASSGTVDEDDG